MTMVLSGAMALQALLDSPRPSRAEDANADEATSVSVPSMSSASLPDTTITQKVSGHLMLGFVVTNELCQAMA